SRSAARARKSCADVASLINRICLRASCSWCARCAASTYCSRSSPAWRISPLAEREQGEGPPRADRVRREADDLAAQRSSRPRPRGGQVEVDCLAPVLERPLALVRLRAQLGRTGIVLGLVLRGGRGRLRLQLGECAFQFPIGRWHVSKFLVALTH